MKKLILASLVLFSFAALAEEMEVLNTRVNAFGRTNVDAKFQVDKATGEGSVNVVVEELTQDPFPGPYYCDQWGRCFPRPNPLPQYVRVYSKTVKVDALSLVGDKIMFAGREGNVECGTLGISRVFKRPTIYLSGNCELSGRVVNRQLTVTLTTK